MRTVTENQNQPGGKIVQSTVMLAGMIGEERGNLLFTRLSRRGFKCNGGWNSLDRGWLRYAKSDAQKTQYAQCSWSINNDGEWSGVLTLTKFISPCD